MSTLGNSKSFALRPDAQAFDEIRITTVPRYKMSGLSGDEWRISSLTQFFRKGAVILEIGHRDIDRACALLYADLRKAIDDGKAYFAGDGKFCDQEGCNELATVFYRKKDEYCREGHKTKPFHISIRSFCERHKQRGDCGLDDADDNYEPEAKP